MSPTWIQRRRPWPAATIGGANRPATRRSRRAHGADWAPDATSPSGWDDRHQAAAGRCHGPSPSDPRTAGRCPSVSGYRPGPKPSGRSILPPSVAAPIRWTGATNETRGWPWAGSYLSVRPRRKRRTGPQMGPRSLEEIRRRPTLPGSLLPSTIGAGGLNFRVRNGNGCDPTAMATEICCQERARSAGTERSSP